MKVSLNQFVLRVQNSFFPWSGFAQNFHSFLWCIVRVKAKLFPNTYCWFSRVILVAKKIRVFICQLERLLAHGETYLHWNKENSGLSVSQHVKHKAQSFLYPSVSLHWVNWISSLWTSSFWKLFWLNIDILLVITGYDTKYVCFATRHGYIGICVFFHTKENQLVTSIYFNVVSKKLTLHVIHLMYVNDIIFGKFDS